MNSSAISSAVFAFSTVVLLSTVSSPAFSEGSAGSSSAFWKSVNSSLYIFPLIVRKFRLIVSPLILILLPLSRKTGYSIYAGSVGELIVFCINGVYPVVQLVHAVQIKCICSESFDLSGDGCLIGALLASDQTDNDED